MRKLVTYLLPLVFPLSLLSQNFDWLRITGDIDNDFGQWVQADSAGNVYVAGHAQGNCNFDGQVIASADPFWFVAKYDSNGFNSWVTKVPFQNGYLFEMRDFQVNKKGETYIVGDVNTNGGLYGMLVKVDDAGNLIKQTTPFQTQNITSIDFDSNGNYYIGGVGYQSGNTNMFISRYSSTDVLSWQTTFTGSYGLYSNLSLRVSSDNGLLFSFIFKNSVTLSDQLSNSIVLDATQGILDDDRVVAKYDSNGGVLWAEKYDDKIPSRQMEIDPLTDNFFILAYNASESKDYLIRFNASGNLLSSQVVSNHPSPLIFATHIRVNNSNLYFIGSGLSLRAGGHSMGFFTLKRFDLDGNLTGQFSPPQQMNSILGDIAFHENSIYLVGGTYNGTWGNEVFTAHGEDYGDFFLTKMRENNISVVSKVEETKSLIDFEVYPNPAQDNVYVRISSEAKGEIVLRDITGKVLSVLQTTGEQTQVISLSQFGSGVYFISWSNGAQVTKKKIVKL